MPQMPGGGRTGREKKRAVRKGLPVPAMKKAGMYKKSTPTIERRKGNTALKPIGMYKKSTPKIERRKGNTALKPIGVYKKSTPKAERRAGTTTVARGSKPSARQISRRKG